MRKQVGGLNMFKNINKKVSAVLAAAILASSFSGAAPVKAANVQNKDIKKVKVENNTGNSVKAGEATKENSTKVYLNITSSPSLYMQVRTYGNRNGILYFNETKGTTATVRRSVESSITNYVYEHRKAGNNTVGCMLKLRSNTKTAGEVNGYWSPDSTKNYKVVNK